MITQYRSLLCFIVALFSINLLCAAEVDKSTVIVRASTWETKDHGGVGDFPPKNTLDGKVSVESSWRGEGKGAWIQWDLGRTYRLRSVEIAFLFGDKRYYTFDLLVTASPDGSRDWRPVRLKARSSGTTLDFESFACEGAPVRHVKLVGYGNSSEKFPEWNNLTEVRFVVE